MSMLGGVLRFSSLRLLSAWAEQSVNDPKTEFSIRINYSVLFFYLKVRNSKTDDS